MTYPTQPESADMLHREDSKTIELARGSVSAEGWTPFRRQGHRCIPHGWYLLELPEAEPAVFALNVRIGKHGEQRPLSSIAVSDRKGALLLVDDASDVLNLQLPGDNGNAGMSSCRIRRVHPANAAWIMYWMIVRARAASGIAIHVASMILATALEFGPRLAVRRLFELYLSAIDRRDRGFSQRVWRVRRGLGPRSDATLLTPKARAAAEAPAGSSFTWNSDGIEARFALTRLDGAMPVLRAGWYRLRGKVEFEIGTWEAPQFSLRYIDAKQPLELQLRLPEPDQAGRIDALVLFDHDVGSLAFEPSVSPSRFRMDSFSLQQLGKVRWAIRLLGSLRTPAQTRDWAGIVNALKNSAVNLLSGGPAAAGAALAQPYHEANLRQSRSYELWASKYDTLPQDSLEKLCEQGQSLAKVGPLVSILVPVFETPEAWLRRCLDSVLAQVYPKWELCIADDMSRAPHVRRVLQEYAKRDSRIRIVYRQDNGHISEASNSALAIARGEYIGLLDHDDELRPHALLEMVSAIVADPRRRLLYSDEDKIDEMGRRFQPYFKPDWNPDLLLGQNYLCHFIVIATDLVRSVGGFRRGFEGSQDHDLVLRCSRGLDALQIHHVPKVLYHWRAIAGSTALERNAKDYASEAGVAAVADHLRQAGSQACVEQLAHGHYRVRWPLPEPVPKVSVVIPTRDRVDLLRTCVESVLSTKYEDFELVVVDNQSTDPETLSYLERLRTKRAVRVLSYDAPFNFSKINNWAVSQCEGELICLLNNDIEATDPDWLREMVAHAIRPGIGAVGAMLHYPDGRIQHAGVILGVGGVANHAYTGQPPDYPGHGSRALVAQNLSAVTGACLVVTRKAYESVGGLDEHLRVAFNDIDFCLRLREQGLRNVWTPFAALVHHESASRGGEDTTEKQQRFMMEVEHMEKRWGELLREDPAYNRILSLDGVNSALAFPPRQNLTK